MTRENKKPPVAAGGHANPSEKERTMTTVPETTKSSTCQHAWCTEKHRNDEWDSLTPAGEPSRSHSVVAGHAWAALDETITTNGVVETALRVHVAPPVDGLDLNATRALIADLTALAAVLEAN
jgi:hypothetical protein